jgi:hypothetical protein
VYGVYPDATVRDDRACNTLRLMLEPTYAELMDTIIAVHGRGNPDFARYWSDVYDGRAWRAFPQFWESLRQRIPGGTVEQVVSGWSPVELKRLYDRLLWGARG